MAHGTKDYGVSSPKATVYAAPDLAELAARLGSPVTHDRRGDVIWLDTFANGIESWVLGGDGAGNSQDWSANHGKWSGFSLQHTTGSNGLEQSFQMVYLPYPVLGGLGFEIHFNLGINILYFSIYLLVTTGTHALTGYIDYVFATDTFRYRDSGGGYPALSPTRDIVATPYWGHVAKLVCDFSAEEYIRFIFDDHEYDMSDIALYKVESPTEPYLRPEIQFYGVPAATRNAWVNGVIVTQNEE